MNKEEKEAIEVLKQIRNSLYVEENYYEWQLAVDTILNYIDKLQKKLNKIENLINTSPYVAYTSYGDILYESDDILEILKEE